MGLPRWVASSNDGGLHLNALNIPHDADAIRAGVMSHQQEQSDGCSQ